jgi:hypothetical protein
MDAICHDVRGLEGRYVIVADDRAMDDDMPLYPIISFPRTFPLLLIPADLPFQISICDRRLETTIDRRVTIAKVQDLLNRRFTFEGNVSIQYGRRDLPPHLPLHSLPSLAKRGLSVVCSHALIHVTFIDLTTGLPKDLSAFDITNTVETVLLCFTSYEGEYHFYADQGRSKRVMEDRSALLADIVITGEPIFYELIRRIPDEPAAASDPTPPPQRPLSTVAVTLVLPPRDRTVALNLSPTMTIRDVLVEANSQIGLATSFSSGNYGALQDDEEPFLALTRTLGDLGPDDIYIFVRQAPSDPLTSIRIPIPVPVQPQREPPPPVRPVVEPTAPAQPPLLPSKGRAPPPSRTVRDLLAVEPGHALVSYLGIELRPSLEVKSREFKASRPTRSVPAPSIRPLELELESELRGPETLAIAGDSSVGDLRSFLSLEYAMNRCSIGVFDGESRLPDAATIDAVPAKVRILPLRPRPCDFGSILRRLMRETRESEQRCRLYLNCYDHDPGRAKEALLSSPDSRRK